MEHVFELDDSAPNHQLFATVLEQYGDCLHKLGRGREAVLTYCRAVGELSGPGRGETRLGGSSELVVKLCRRVVKGVRWYLPVDFEAVVAALEAGVSAGERLIEARHDPQDLRDLAAFHDSVGHIRMAQGDVKAARYELGCGFDCWQVFTQTDAAKDDLSVWLEFARSHLHVAEAERKYGDIRAAMETLGQALRLLTTLATYDSSDEVLLCLAQVCSRLGALYIIFHHSDVDGVYQQGWDLARNLVRRNPRDPRMREVLDYYEETWSMVRGYLE